MTKLSNDQNQPKSPKSPKVTSHMLSQHKINKKMEQKLQSKVVSEVDEVDSIHDSDMAREGLAAVAAVGKPENGN